MTLPLFNIGGLMSGLDTNSIIEGLLSVERIPINQLQARKADYAAKDNAWQDVNTRFSAIRTALSAIDSQTDLDKLVTATSSNESAVTATATGSATPGTISFTVDRLATTHQVASTTNFAGGSDLVGAGDFTVTLGGSDHVVTADASTTLDGVAQQINALDAGVHASVLAVDATTSKLVITSDDSGSAASFTTSSTIASLASTTVVEQGDDAELTVGSGPGALTVSRASNTVTDLVSGVTIELAAESAAPVTVTVNRDADATVEAITTLVTEINSALSKLGELTAYNAESDTGGALVGDGTARDLIIDLRSAISGTVNAASVDYPIPSSIGISLTREGTFEVDEEGLRAALSAGYEDTTDLLDALSTSLDTMLDEVEGSGGRISRARDAWQAQVDLVEDRIEILEDRIERREGLLLKQFSALESAMATLTSQAAWLSSQMGALNGGGSTS